MTPSEFAPIKPRLHRSYQVFAVPGTDEIQVQSEARTLRLTPVDSSGLLCALIPLLDGSHTVSDIIVRLESFDESLVLQSLEQLKDARILEEGAVEDNGLSSEQRERFASQLILFSHVTTNPCALQAKLADSHVAVLGVDPLGSHVVTSLAECGIGHVRGIGVSGHSEDGGDTHGSLRIECLTRNPSIDYQGVVLERQDEAMIQAALEGSDVVVVAADRHLPDLLTTVNTVCLETSTTWLPFGLTAWEGFVGATVLPRQTACYMCRQLRVKANLLHYESFLLYEEHLRNADSRPFGGLCQFTRVISELAAIEVIRLLTNFSKPTTLGRMLAIDFRTCEVSFHDVLKLPRCPACGEPSRKRPTLKPWSE